MMGAAQGQVVGEEIRLEEGSARKGVQMLCVEAERKGEERRGQEEDTCVRFQEGNVVGGARGLAMKRLG